MNERVLVTGASGRLGADLVEVLGRRFEVTACSRRDFDITDRQAVRTALHTLKPTVVLHAAACTDVDRCEDEPDAARRVNAEAAEYVADACREIRAYLIYYSTDYVFAGDQRRPYAESDPPDPKNVYGQSKLEGERRVREAIDEYCILRLAWIYGRQGKDFVSRMIELGRAQLRAARRGETIEPVRAADDQIGNPTWAVDIARQTEEVIRRRIWGVCHCSSDGEASRYDLAARVYSRLHMPVRLELCSSGEHPRRARRPAYSSLENAALKAAGCHVMRPWKEALDEFLQINKEALSDADRD